MKVNKTSLGWEIQPETSNEQEHLQRLIESLQDHRGQQINLTTAPNFTVEATSIVFKCGAQKNRIAGNRIEGAA